jgi:hypothetical protein
VSAWDRDARRPYTPAPGTAIPTPVRDEVTGNYSGPELESIRARRPTPERLLRLERKQDQADEFKAVIVDRLGHLEGAVGGLDAKVEILIDLHRQEREDRRAETSVEKVRIGSRAKIVVAIAGACGALFSAVAYALYALAKGWG